MWLSVSWKTVDCKVMDNASSHLSPRHFRSGSSRLFTCAPGARTLIIPDTVNCASHSLPTFRDLCVGDGYDICAAQVCMAHN